MIYILKNLILFKFFIICSRFVWHFHMQIETNGYILPYAQLMSSAYWSIGHENRFKLLSDIYCILSLWISRQWETSRKLRNLINYAIMLYHSIIVTNKTMRLGVRVANKPQPCAVNSQDVGSLACELMRNLS